ncbi:hypothetical protein HHK36_000065 [Tetracentron sinense]|uniref:RING-type E3 ubiquitin transferase n=1 Tax=Tetracentron sinense TaxID=13715 RepID=A0A834ZUU9_TETSI|nr:hypothetical protein HHK36_000065 [Tetracentron sinense]
MEGKAKTTSFSFFFFFTFLLSRGFAELLEYQSLVLEPLSKPPTHKPDLSWSESETAETDSETSTLTVRLEHRDALAFNATPEALFNLRLERDAARVETIIAMATGAHVRRNGNLAHGMSGSSSRVISGISQGSGEYFTRLGVGTPPNYVYMVLDTGSDIVWIQCSPCRKCYSQSDPIFNPKKSSSFAAVSCQSPLCRQLDVSGCNKRKSCLYQVLYGDGSFTVGELSTETLAFGRTKVGRVALGCGRDNEGLFIGAAGLLGLGRGKLSFPSQTGRRFGRKFSYCLVDRSSTTSKPSSLVFGESAVSRSAVFTPMLTNPKQDTFYYVGLTGISVGGKRVRGIRASTFRIDTAGKGGVIIDSGTSVTRLTRPAYLAFRDAFRAGTTELKGAPEFSLFDTCYDLSGKMAVKVPTVVMHFGRRVNLNLPPQNYMIPVDNRGSFCLAFAGTMNKLSIIGNIQQQGFRIMFDSAGSRIGFAPHGIECIWSSDGIDEEEINQFSSKPHTNIVSSANFPATSVHELLECPVCTNSMYPPIHQCHNGHTLCSTCKTRVHNQCPTCRQELGDIRCLALEKVAESLEFPCKYYSLGCPEIFPYYSKLKHEAQCNYRPYNCPYAGSKCSVVGDIPFLVAHLRDDHKVDMHTGCTFNHRYVKSNPREVENATWMLTPSMGRLPVYMAFLRFMGDETDARNFSYSLEVGGNGRKLTWEGNPRSIRDSHRKVRDSHDGLIIQRNMALFFSGGDRKELKLRVTGRIWKEQQKPDSGVCIPKLGNPTSVAENNLSVVFV